MGTGYEGGREKHACSCVSDSSTARRLAFETNVQHTWCSVELGRGMLGRSNKASFSPCSDMASLLGLFWLSSLFHNKACWFICEEDGKHLLTAIKVRTDLWWSWRKLSGKIVRVEPYSSTGNHPKKLHYWYDWKDLRGRCWGRRSRWAS